MGAAREHGLLNALTAAGVRVIVDNDYRSSGFAVPQLTPPVTPLIEQTLFRSTFGQPRREHRQSAQGSRHQPTLRQASPSDQPRVFRTGFISAFYAASWLSSQAS